MASDPSQLISSVIESATPSPSPSPLSSVSQVASIATAAISSVLEDVLNNSSNSTNTTTTTATATNTTTAVKQIPQWLNYTNTLVSGFLNETLFAYKQQIISQYREYNENNTLPDAFISFNSTLSSVTSLTWLWDKLPFPPILLTYFIILFLATFVVVVSSRSTIVRPRTSGVPDKSSPYYHPMDESASLQEDIFSKVTQDLIKKHKSVALSATSRTSSSLKELKKYRHEMVGATEAYLMPVFGAIGLVGLYFSYKYFDAVNIQSAMSVYFSFVAFVSTIATVSLIIKSLARIGFHKTIPHWRFTLADDHEYHNMGMEPGFDKMEEEIEKHKKAQLKKKKEKKRKQQEKDKKKNKNKDNVITEPPKPKKQPSTTKTVKKSNKVSNEKDKEAKVEICTPIAARDQYLNFYFSAGDLIGIPISLALVTLQYFTGNWLFGNILAMAVAIQGICTLRLDSFKTGLIMLGGLFLYDIYFVFGTDVMVTVATKLQVPIKLEIPRPLSITELEKVASADDVSAAAAAAAAAAARATAMLGLGDIVIPALYLSLCLRYDLYRFYEKAATIVVKPSSLLEKESSTVEVSKEEQQEEEEDDEKILLPFHLARPYPKPFFNAGIVAYAIGLVITIGVMHVFKAGQPALLYLCPAIAGSTLLTAYLRGEVKNIFAYRDQEEDKEKDDDEDEDESEDEDEEEKKNK